MPPLLSILCITYNHAPFIRQALDGFVMQKTNFPFEVIIHDDASTDGTADIIREYEAKYPDIIKPIYQTENQWSKGLNINKTFIFPKINGKYVALCEGDDYWTDPNKLQSQVDFLENNPDFAVCFHPVKVVWDDNRSADTIFPKPKMRFNKTVLTLDDLLQQNFIQTNSVVYRWAFNKGKYNTIPDGILPGDWFLHLLHAKTGKIGFLPQVMSVYRRHSGGIWTGCGETDDWFMRCGIPHLRFYREIEKTFNTNKSCEISNMGSLTVNALTKAKNWQKLDELANEFPSYWNSFFDENCKIKSEKKKLKHLRKINKILLSVVLILLIWLCFSILG